MSKTAKKGVIGGILCSCFAWLFFLVALEPRWFQSIDNLFSQLPQWRTPAVESLFLPLASTATIIPIAFVHFLLACFLFMRKQRLESLWLMGNMIVISGVGQVIKKVVDRPRPDFADSMERASASFPSGHTLLATTLIISLLFFLGQTVPAKRGKRHFIQNMALFLGLIYLLLIMMSRLLFGVHYPSDLLASILLASGISYITYAFVFSIKKYVLRGR
ncbi:phosphatase PAP2 family protein [Enterococcus entomosocium]|uniref:phosphatase PAP2 family protein n=1 Tax=Enterococcus entomosocium TaxID=3034352 RepID=UPI003B5B45C2